MFQRLRVVRLTVLQPHPVCVLWDGSERWSAPSVGPPRQGIHHFDH